MGLFGKKGKSFTRRYYEELMDKFEEEFKKMKTKEEIEEKKTELMRSLNEGVERKLLTGQDIHFFLQRISKLEKERMRETMSAVDTSKERMKSRTAIVSSGGSDSGGMTIQAMQRLLEKRKKEANTVASFADTRETMARTQDSESFKTKKEVEDEKKIMR